MRGSFFPIPRTRFNCHLRPSSFCSSPSGLVAEVETHSCPGTHGVGDCIGGRLGTEATEGPPGSPWQFLLHSEMPSVQAFASSNQKANEILEFATPMGGIVLLSSLISVADLQYFNLKF